MSEATNTTRRLAKLQVGIAFLVDALKGEGARSFKVTKNALPSDAKFVWAYTDRSNQNIYAVLESESFVPVREGGLIPELPVPFCETIR